MFERDKTELAEIGMVVETVAVDAWGDQKGFELRREEAQLPDLGLAGLTAMALVVASAPRLRLPSMPVALGGVVLIVVIGTLGVWWSVPQLFQQVTSDLMRLTPDPSRMAVREARPLFLYSGKWQWSEPWQLLGSSVYIGALALVPFARVAWQSRRPGDALVWVFGVSTLAATIAQNRFAYYLMPALAILIGWLADEMLTWGGWVRRRMNAEDEARVPLQREVALAAAAAMLLAPALTAAKLLGQERTGAAQHWLDTAFWLRQHTPTPFSSAGGDAYYFARYGSRVAEPGYTIMTWWDYGYLITQRARRVPVSNPTQANAPVSARFYVETDEGRAVAILREQRARFVLADYEQPFRYSADGRIMGQLQSILDWAGATHDDYYRVCFRRIEGAWLPLWMFRDAYYRSMAFRLAIAGGAAM
jgi:asparagine N-glycosylation enzyme membrane subunit Stt3